MTTGPKGRALFPAGQAARPCAPAWGRVYSHLPLFVALAERNLPLVCFAMPASGRAEEAEGSAAPSLRSAFFSLCHSPGHGAAAESCPSQVFRSVILSFSKCSFFQSWESPRTR